jgi:hypothetical protein
MISYKAAHASHRSCESFWSRRLCNTDVLLVCHDLWRGTGEYVMDNFTFNDKANYKMSKTCATTAPSRQKNRKMYQWGLQHIQGGSNMTGTNCDLFTHKSSRSYLNHLVYAYTHDSARARTHTHLSQWHNTHNTEYVATHTDTRTRRIIFITFFARNDIKWEVSPMHVSTAK